MDSFYTGEQFEKYVERKIFTSKDYSISEKTHSAEQNNERFIESSKKPDFKFKCRRTGQEFYVEAKFRSSYYDDKIEILKLSQYVRFQELNRKEHPVFFIVGVGGSPSDPNSLSLIPFNAIRHSEVYKSVITSHSIEKAPLKQDLILDKISNLFPDEESLRRISSLPYTGYEQERPHSSAENRPKRSLKKAFLVIPLLAILILLGYNFISKSKPPSESNLKNKIESYYDILHHNNLNQLDYFLNPSLDRWYSFTNVDIDFVKKYTAAYNEKYPIRQATIEWDTYRETILPNGDYSVSYNLDYKLKSKSSSEFKTYHLNIKAIWDKDLKLRSMYEERLN